MENISTFLKWTFGVILTLTIIAAGVMLWNKASPIIASANNQAAQQANAIGDDEYSAFDNQLVSGSQVLTAFRRYSNHDVFYLYIQTNNNATIRNFGMQPNGSIAACTNFNYTLGTLQSGTAVGCNITQLQVTDNASIYYIPPQARFLSVLLRDLNKRVTGIYFKAQ
jgi:hypothetical protein